MSSLTPVLDAAHEGQRQQPEDGIALCLSGGGYRAMLFHVGSLWRLNELHLLHHLRRVSSVSGGSITAGLLGIRWKVLGLHEKSQALQADFLRWVVHPLRQMAGVTIDVSSVGWGILSPFSTVADFVAEAYAKHLFDHHTLEHLPVDPAEGPRFVINATNVKTGALWRFSRPYMADYLVGVVPNPKTPISLAVAASSAFPPFLSPVRLPLNRSQFDSATIHPELEDSYYSEAVLTDGGVYDNLGLETAWKRFRTVLVSDGGRRMANDAAPSMDWGRHSFRLIELLQHQTSNLRRKLLVHSYQLPNDHLDYRKGAYWGIQTNVLDYQLPDAIACDFAKTQAIAAIDTRLAAMPDAQQEQLINWGYAVCDAAVRRYYPDFTQHLPDPATVPAPRLPYLQQPLN